MRNKVERVPVEPKVSIGTLVGGSGAILSAFILWLLGVTVFEVPFNSDQADDAIAAVPWPITGVVGLVLTVGGYFFGGYMAPHVARPEDAPQPVVVNNVSSFPEYDELEEDSNADLPGEVDGLSNEAEDLPDVDQDDESLPEDGIPNDPEKA